MPDNTTVYVCRFKHAKHVVPNKHVFLQAILIANASELLGNLKYMFPGYDRL